MSVKDVFEVRRYDFNTNLADSFQQLHYAKDLWPIVYILSVSLITKSASKNPNE